MAATGLYHHCCRIAEWPSQPRVQRQYCGATRKVDNCVVIVHLACQCGPFAAILDNDLFLPEETWDRGRNAGVPDHGSTPASGSWPWTRSSG